MVVECEQATRSCRLLAVSGRPEQLPEKLIEELRFGTQDNDLYKMLWPVTAPRIVMREDANLAWLAAASPSTRVQGFWVWPLGPAGERLGPRWYLCTLIADVTQVSIDDAAQLKSLALCAAVALQWLGAAREVSETQSLLRQETLRSETLNLELQQTVRTKDSFMNLAAHELRTPLSALMLQADSAARLLTKTPLNSARLNHKVGAILKQVERLQHLVEDLLDVTRVEQGKFVLRHEAVDVAGLTHKVIERLGDAFARAHCELHTNITGPVDGTFDAMRLDQVISNLVVNALKYGMGKPVSIVVTRQDGHVVISVTDQGIGIAPEQHQVIFERYGRAVSERDYGGLGLGLWISQQIVTALGGTITVRSALGEGATFTVSLPLAS